MNYKVRKLSYTEWLKRTDEFLLFTLGKTTESFNGIIWVKLYDAGLTAGDVTEALFDELRKVNEDSTVAIVN